MTDPNARDERRDALIAYARANPDGFTREQAIDALDLTDGRQYDEAVRDVRLDLEAGTETLIADPDGTARWVYRLVGNGEEAAPWLTNRIRDGEARCRTMLAVSTAAAASLDARTTAGKRARIMAVHLGRLVEDFDNMDGFLGGHE